MNTYIYHEKNQQNNLRKASWSSLQPAMWSLVHEKRNVSRKHSPKTSVLRTVAILQREPTREFTRVSIGSAFSASAKQMPQ